MLQIPGPVIVIDDGGVAALVACCLCLEPARAMSLLAAGRGPSAPAVARAIRRKADLLGLGAPIEPPAARDRKKEPSEGAELPDEPAEATDRLLFAGREALRLGLGRVVWPAHFGTDLDGMDRALSRARLVERLVNLDAAVGPSGEGAVRIETPLLDLTDGQIAELAADLDAPLEACWWCRKDGPAPCGRCGGCRRWEPALTAARLSPRSAAG